VNRDDAAGIADRDWDRIDESKIAAWRDSPKTPDQAFRHWATLLGYARTLRPDLPTDESLAEDLASHERVAEMFRRASV
jgi:hypothetical protein